MRSVSGNGSGRPRWRRLARWAAVTVVAVVAASVLAVLLLRFMPPLTSAFMVARWIDARAGGERDFSLDYRWRPLEEISAQLPIAVVAAEDQKFPSHRGFDLDAIRSALDAADEGARLRGALRDERARRTGLPRLRRAALSAAQPPPIDATDRPTGDSVPRVRQPPSRRRRRAAPSGTPVRAGPGGCRPPRSAGGSRAADRTARHRRRRTAPTGAPRP